MLLVSAMSAQRDTSNIPVTNDEIQSMTMRCSLSAKEAAHNLVNTRNTPRQDTS
jgi:hypothetical protein